MSWLIAVVFVVLVYLLAMWVNKKMKWGIETDIIQVACVILLLLLLLGKVSLPF